jgi:hypothetical protein
VPRNRYDFFFSVFFSVVADVPVAGAVDVDVPLVAVMPVPVVPVVAVIDVSVVDIVPVVPVIDVSVVAVLAVDAVSVAVVIDVSVAAVSVFVFSSFLHATANRASTKITPSVRANDFFICRDLLVSFSFARTTRSLGDGMRAQSHARRGRNILKVADDVKQP